jgi:hypothetical protein
MSIGEARTLAPGTEVSVRGVVIAEAGRLGTPPLLAIADATGGVAVRVSEATRVLPRGSLVEVRGEIASPYGQTEIRPGGEEIAVLGTAPAPAPAALEAGAIGESNEGRLARVRGTIIVSAVRATSGDLAFTITGDDGASLRVLADASAGLDAASLRKGLEATFTGVVGQRASHKGALDGYRLWLRDERDIARIAGGSPTSSPGASAPPASGAAAAPRVSVARALGMEGRRVTVEGVLTVDRSLLDATGRRTILQDRTGAIEILLDAPDGALRKGVRVRVTGMVGRAWGAPRLRAEDARVTGRGAAAALALRTEARERHEWRLVRVTGAIVEVHRSGDRWTAELANGSLRLPVHGLPGAGIESSTVYEGRRATVTGIVKRPYPTAKDRRFAIVPRGPADLVLGPVAPSGSPGTAAPGTATGPGGATASAPAPAGSPGMDAGVPDADLAELAMHVGHRVRVGGLVIEIDGNDLFVDDGTALGTIALTGAAVDLAALLWPGDALNATGTPERRDEAIVVVVSDPGDVELVGDLGGASEPGNESPADEPPADEGAGQAHPSDGSADHAGGAVRAGLGAGFGLDPAPAGLGSLALVAALSVLVTVARRHRARRLLQARIAARLEALGLAGQPRPDTGSRPSDAATPS